MPGPLGLFLPPGLDLALDLEKQLVAEPEYLEQLDHGDPPDSDVVEALPSPADPHPIRSAESTLEGSGAWAAAPQAAGRSGSNRSR